MQPDWDRLKAEHPTRLVDNLRVEIERADTAIIDPELLSKRSKTGFDETRQLLSEVARLGALLFKEEKRCGQCGAIASPEDEEGGMCPRCGVRYLELEEPFKVRTVFKLPGGRRSRDISWLVTVHGMNTDGPWQQDLSWNIAKRLKYSAPVLIFKYPIFRVMALFERTQRLAAAELGERLRAAENQASRRVGELNPLPDVILHSYGTLLFSRLMLDIRYKDLRFGRVILAGSIVPPDYDWSQHIRSGRIEQVINHCGDKDDVVYVAQYLMPNAGPSGKIGFLDLSVVNVQARGYGHGTFFDPGRIRTNLSPNGSWDRFLTAPADRVAGGEAVNRPERWSKSWLALPARFLLKVLVFLGLGPLVWLSMQAWDAVRAIIWAR